MTLLTLHFCSYGFAIKDNPEDTFGLEIVVGGEGGGRRSLGTFDIRRRGDDGGTEREQFPTELWAALASLYDDSDVEGDGEQQIGAEEVELLLATLAAKLKPFDLTCQADAENMTHANDRIRSGAYYRAGQRDILRQAVVSLQEMLDGVA